MRPNYQHTGPRRRTSWWRGPWPPSILLALLVPLVIWELTWAWPLLTGE
ncbi:hypothetical protein HF576_01835 [Microbacterium sp. CFH 90308]|uniref:ABC transporter permease n=1 Tax=Microbacterium salsuginis TaxID=2722803 RepID=A0ABX1K6R0_9MICO|nr:hypothetical protein [Microbacterium sp. CFH 90308]NLP82579.1 hypothetical protein [Microbacterium sp. CFH 90308]